MRICSLSWLAAAVGLCTACGSSNGGSTGTSSGSGAPSSTHTSTASSATSSPSSTSSTRAVGSSASSAATSSSPASGGSSNAPASGGSSMAKADAGSSPSSGVTDASTGTATDDGGPASGATTTVAGSGCTPPSQYENLFVTLLGQTQASSDAKLAAVWSQLFDPSAANTIFYDGPQSGESYIEDIADADVRTEGQSYGMMIAVQLDHQAEFDRLWAFAKHYMYQANTGQFAWHVKTSGQVISTGGAPDGDEWFATALVFAHSRWGDTSGKYNYKTEAQSVLDMVRTQDFDAANHLVQYYAGAGNTSGGTDGSYILPAYYQVWACFDTAHADFWNAAVSAGRAFFHAAADSNGVIGDQSSFTGQTTNSSGDDKLRCVANIMSDHNFFDADPWQTQTYAPEYAAHEANGTTSTAELACDGLLGFGLPSSSGTKFVSNLWNAPVPTGMWRYYDGTLYTIALLHVSGAFRLWY